jgi:hypothetical protein
MRTASVRGALLWRVQEAKSLRAKLSAELLSRINRFDAGRLVKYPAHPSLGLTQRVDYTRLPTAPIVTRELRRHVLQHIALYMS